MQIVNCKILPIGDESPEYRAGRRSAICLYQHNGDIRAWRPIAPMDEHVESRIAVHDVTGIVRIYYPNGDHNRIEIKYPDAGCIVSRNIIELVTEHVAAAAAKLQEQLAAMRTRAEAAEARLKPVAASSEPPPLPPDGSRWTDAMRLNGYYCRRGNSAMVYRPNKNEQKSIVALATWAELIADGHAWYIDGNGNRVDKPWIPDCKASATDGGK